MNEVLAERISNDLAAESGLDAAWLALARALGGYPAASLAARNALSRAAVALWKFLDWAQP